MVKRHHEDEEDALVQELRRVVREESSFRSLRKNGDTWGGWLSKIATPDRILWLIMAIFVLGGRVQQYTIDLSGAVTSVQTLKSEVSNLNGLIQKHEALLAQRAGIEDEHATKTDVNRLQDVVRQAITRQEFQSVLRTQILPRLDRIESQNIGR